MSGARYIDTDVTQSRHEPSEGYASTHEGYAFTQAYPRGMTAEDCHPDVLGRVLRQPRVIYGSLAQLDVASKPFVAVGEA